MMSITKSFTLPNDDSGDHWEVMRISQDRFLEILSFDACLFRNEQACRDKKPIIYLDRVVFSEGDYATFMAAVTDPQNPVFVYTQIYTQMMGMVGKPWFGGTVGLDVYGVPE